MLRDYVDFEKSASQTEPARALFRWLRQGHATQLGNGTMSCNALSGLHAARVIKSRRGARHASRLLGAAAAICLFGVAPIVAGNLAPASAQVHGTQLSGEFRRALQPYGRWERHSRWGEVWLPGNRARGWRPYTEGRWVYSNDWGWYWAEPGRGGMGLGYVSLWTLGF